MIAMHRPPAWMEGQQQLLMLLLLLLQQDAANEAHVHVYYSIYNYRCV
jgi:hypothetical protein